MPDTNIPDSKPNLLDYVVEEFFESPDSLFAKLRLDEFRSGRWVFRGQARASWALQPSLERFIRSIRDSPDVVEKYTIREFRRRAHFYTSDLPDLDNDLEWLSLMRHHGTPTRLLDFTKSPYVAAFFATAEAIATENCAIWAIDATAIRKHSIAMMKGYIGTRNHFDLSNNDDLQFSQPEVFRKFINYHNDIPSKVVVPVEPFRFNGRMLTQQGLFLCISGKLNWLDFEQAMAVLLQFADKTDPSVRLAHKLVISRETHIYVLRELHRMNVNYVSLLPGLDSLGQTLATVSKIRAFTVPFPQRPDWSFDQSF